MILLNITWKYWQLDCFGIGTISWFKIQTELKISGHPKFPKPQSCLWLKHKYIASFMITMIYLPLHHSESVTMEIQNILYGKIEICRRKAVFYLSAKAYFSAFTWDELFSLRSQCLCNKTRKKKCKNKSTILMTFL